MGFLAKCLLASATIVLSIIAADPIPAETFSDDSADPIAKLTKMVESQGKTIGAMARQMMLQQLFIEEKVRSDADSGIKQVRLNSEGTRNYHSASHTTPTRVVSIHDHSNNVRTVGMGEFIAVLNGVEFRTRHNDYRLYMPHRTSKDWHAKEPIPFPEVPPAVKAKKTVNEQISEMREWFKAWKNQDHSVRDYRKYFKPVLCYLEGAWTTETKGAIDEPFESDRHFVDASSWFDLQEKIRFTSYTGRKDNLENFSFLPTTVMNVTKDGHPQFAQWNYRIMCNPISRDLPLDRLRMVDELAPRMTGQKTYEEQLETRSARFQLNPSDTNKWREGVFGKRYGLLDELMAEIPGKDNYPGDLTDEAFGLSVLNLDPGQAGKKLNVAKYHRWFKVGAKGAMGTSIRHRGYADQNLFMAMTTQPKVAGMTLQSCKKINKKEKVCSYLEQKWSYAIPLEIIYLTPLSSWNPYDIEYKNDARSTLGKTVEAGGRNGGKTKAKAYNGTHSRAYYLTPAEFFTGGEVGTDAADTTKIAVGVLDRKGDVRTCSASGTRIFFPNIQGVGKLRQRYPIMPVHGEGSAVWKELEALKDAVLWSNKYGYVFREPLQPGPVPTDPPRKPLKLEITEAHKNPPGAHVHLITLNPDQVDYLKKNSRARLEVTSTESAGHMHTVQLRWIGGKRQSFDIVKCDGKSGKGNWRCWDQHFRFLAALPGQ